MIKQLIVGEYDLSDWGVQFGSKSLYNAPKRNVENISVPGRNGDVIIDHGNWENIDVTYSCFIEGKAKERIFDLKQVIISQLGYVKISDSENLDEFRLGYYKEGLDDINPSLEVKNIKFNITFNCKPQRFLSAGDEWHSLKNGDRLYNPTLFAFSPLFKIQTSDSDYGYIEIDGYSIKVKNTHGVEYLYIDTETMQCYSDNELLNDCVEFSSDNTLKVASGGRQVSISSNIYNVEVKTRWFTL